MVILPDCLQLFHPDRGASAMEEMRVRPSLLITALITIGILVGLTLFFMRAPIPKELDAANEEFSAARALQQESAILAEGVPHPVGTEANARIRDRIVEKLKSLGYSVEIQESLSFRGGDFYAPVRNILAQIPGRETGPAVLLVTHYDSVGAGPGAGDDGSGVAIFLEIARILIEHAPFRNPVRFLFTDGEEAGLLGAREFINNHPWAKEVGAAINLEARGTSGRSIMFETSENNAWLMSVYAQSVASPEANSLSFEAYKRMPNDTDLSVFKQAGIAGMNFAFIEHSQNYHTSRDNLANLNPGSVQHQGDQVLAVTRTLAEMDLSNPPKGNSIYTDLFGLVILLWPQDWNLTLSLTFFSLIGLTALILLLRRTISWRSFLGGFIFPVLVVALSGCFGSGLFYAISRIAGAQNAWQAYPITTQLALWMGVLLITGILTVSLSRLLGFWDLVVGTLFGWAVLAVICAAFVPGAICIFIIPVSIASILLFVICLFNLNPLRLINEVALLLIVAAASLIWIKLSISLGIGFGLEGGWSVTLPLAFFMATAAPFFLVTPNGIMVRRIVLLAAFVVLIASAGIVAFLPSSPETRPMYSNIIYYEDTDTGDAKWISSNVTEAMKAAGNFDTFGRVFRHKGILGKAGRIGYPAPELAIVSETAADEGRIVNVILRSPRGAPVGIMYIPETVIVKSISMNGKEIELFYGWEDYLTFTYHGLPPEGVQLSIHVQQKEPVTVLIMDKSYGLPDIGEDLMKARALSAVPIQDGDQTVVLHRTSF